MHNASASRKRNHQQSDLLISTNRPGVPRPVGPHESPPENHQAPQGRGQNGFLFVSTTRQVRNRPVTAVAIIYQGELKAVARGHEINRQNTPA